MNLSKNFILKFLCATFSGIIGVSLDLALNKRKLKDGVIFPRLNISSESGCILEGILSILFVLAVLSTHEKKSGRCQGTPSLVFGFGVTVSFLVAVSTNINIPFNFSCCYRKPNVVLTLIQRCMDVNNVVTTLKQRRAFSGTCV